MLWFQLGKEHLLLYSVLLVSIVVVFFLSLNLWDKWCPIRNIKSCLTCSSISNKLPFDEKRVKKCKNIFTWIVNTKHYCGICSAQITVINERFDVFIELLAMTIFSPPSDHVLHWSTFHWSHQEGVWLFAKKKKVEKKHVE